MELALDLTKRYTYEDYVSWGQDVLCELFDGFVKFMSSPSFRHQDIEFTLERSLRGLVKVDKWQYKVVHGIDVRFIEEDSIEHVFCPDISVIGDLSRLHKNYYAGAPLMVIEILSPSTLKKDMNLKFNVYERFGVPVYWVVDSEAKSIVAFQLQEDGKYDDGTLYECGSKVPVSIFEGAEIDTEDIFTESTVKPVDLKIKY